MADADWIKIGLQAGGYLISAVVGASLAIWRAGKHQGREEAGVEQRLRDEMRQSMAAYESKADDRNDLLVSQFRESFEGIRRQIDENRLQTEQRFLPRDEFREFRKEWREGMSELKAMIGAVRQ